MSIKGMKSGLSFRKKTLYYGLMLALTLLVIEGLARIAYYVAYGPGYGGGGAELTDITPPPPSLTWALPLRRQPLF